MRTRLRKTFVCLAQFARHKCRFNYTLSAVWISHTWANAISPLLGDLLFAIRRQTRKSVFFLRKGADENSFVLLNLRIVAFNEYLSSAAAALHGYIILHQNLGIYYWFQRFAKKPREIKNKQLVDDIQMYAASDLSVAV